MTHSASFLSLYVVLLLALFALFEYRLTACLNQLLTDYALLS